MNVAGPSKRLGREALRLLPYTGWGDWLHHLSLFWVAHRRTPKRSGVLLFNDYIFFLKNSAGAYDPLRQFSSDKLLVKLYVSAVIGKEYVPDTLRVFSSAADLENFSAPTPCVVKPTHLSGIVVFLNKGERLSVAQRRTLKLCLNRNLYKESREPNYRYLRPAAIAEAAVGLSHEVCDYKVFCWMGRPRLIQVDVDRHSDHKRVLYDTNWRLLPIEYNYKVCDELPRPRHLEEMLDLAAALSEPFESVRVDFYLTQERIFVGELTHFPEQGHGRFGTLQQEKTFSEFFFGAETVNR
ncbi:MAG: ATP-grasp fold amidoligase family protein [Rhodomicrobium sp.]|jgi:hypothetical protein